MADPATDTEEKHVRPFGEFLQAQRKGSLTAEMANELADLCATVIALQKGGTLTLKISVNPNKDGASVSISDEVTTKLPKPDRGSALFFVDGTGNPVRNDPRQTEIEGLRTVPGPSDEAADAGQNRSMTMEASTALLEARGNNETQAAVDAGLLSAKPEKLGAHKESGVEIYSIVTPAGGTAKEITVDLEKFEKTPRRTSGRYSLDTLESFVEFTKKRQTPELSIFVNADDRLLTAVFNDATKDSPGWRDYRAEAKLEFTPEWQHWLKFDGSFVDQQTFAEHIEDGLAEIASPTAADLLEIAQSFMANTTVDFQQGERLASGETKLKYLETIDAKAGQNGEITIPEEFTLGISPFPGEAPFEIKAKFRYRLRAGQLTLGYKLDHPERALIAIVEEIVTRLRVDFEGAVYVGAPPA